MKLKTQIAEVLVAVAVERLVLGVRGLALLHPLGIPLLCVGVHLRQLVTRQL